MWFLFEPEDGPKKRIHIPFLYIFIQAYFLPNEFLEGMLFHYIPETTSGTPWTCGLAYVVYLRPISPMFKYWIAADSSGSMCKKVCHMYSIVVDWLTGFSSVLVAFTCTTLLGFFPLFSAGQNYPYTWPEASQVPRLPGDPPIHTSK